MSEPNPNACTECEAGRCGQCISRRMCLCDSDEHDRFAAVVVEAFRGFEVAVAKRLGIDPAAARLRGWGDDGHVDFRFHVPADDLYQMASDHADSE